jgi:uncharacterized protein YjbI with pentapeptide repeats
MKVHGACQANVASIAGCRGENEMSLVSAIALMAQAASPTNVVIIPAPNTAPPVARSCRFGAGLVDGTGSVLPAAIDGRRFRTFAAVAALRKAAPVGQIIVIEGGDLSRQNVGAVDLSGVCFRGTKLVNTVWTRTKGLGIGFIDADLTGARFDQVVFDSVLFRNVTLANVNASGARLVFGQLDGGWNASMANLTLDNALMIGFRFICGVTATDGCPFDRKRISMRGTDLSEAKLSSFAFWDTAFNGAKLNKTEIGLDQITQFDGATISGPITLRSGRKTAVISPADFMTLRTKVANTGSDSCASPTTPLLRTICESSQGGLQRLHRDVDALYLSSAGNGSKLSPAQTSYQAALESCVTKGEATARECLAKEMNERRDILITEMLREKPLERGGRALYVSNDTPFVSTSTDTPALAPLLTATSSSYMLVQKDKGRTLNIRASISDAAGNRCSVFDNTKAKPAEGIAMRIWATGADFKVEENKRASQCAANAQSGPLVRIPVTDADFDALWAAAEAG